MEEIENKRWKMHSGKCHVMFTSDLSVWWSIVQVS